MAYFGTCNSNSISGTSMNPALLQNISVAQPSNPLPPNTSTLLLIGLGAIIIYFLK